MSDVLFFAAFLLLPLFGLWTWRIEAVRRMDLAGRLAVAGAAGALVVPVVMALLSLMRVEWSRNLLYPVLGVIAIASFFAQRPSPAASRHPLPVQRGEGRSVALVIILVFAALTCYGILTARESIGDLLFFWGPKGIHFSQAGGIDVDFLSNRNNPNSDYPPLLPLLYAWAHMVAHQFSWWSAVLVTVLFLFAAVAIVRSWSGDNLGAALMAAALSWAFAVGYVAGGGDPPLLLFEALTLGALVFVENERQRDLLAAIGLAGTAWTKIEGATFVIAVVLAMIVLQRRIKRPLLIAVPAAVLVGAWVTFIVSNDLLFGYGGAKMGIHLAIIPKVLAMTMKWGSYELFGLTWIVPLVLVALGNWRRALLPLAVALLTFGAAIFFYIHVPDPSWWIAASAARVLLTPLLCVLIAACAAWRPRSI